MTTHSSQAIVPLQATLDEAFTYRGLCDASAAAALGTDLFVVANDERNQLKIYRRGEADPIDVLDLSGFLGTKPDKESDLEGSATVGERIYWISSHGRNSKGEVQKRRYRFFATDRGYGEVPLVPVGRPCATLLDDLIATEHLAQYKLAEAASSAPESSNGLNIEGLAAAHDGSLLIGLRNPAPRGMALVIPLLNPVMVIEGASAKFGEAIELDLGALAIRSIELVGLAYLIVAGPPADEGEFALYQWSGKRGEPALKLDHTPLGSLRPEALFAIPGTRRVQLLSDDGGKHVKNLPEDQQQFRSVTMTL